MILPLIKRTFLKFIQRACGSSEVAPAGMDSRLFVEVTSTTQRIDSLTMVPE